MNINHIKTKECDPETTSPTLLSPVNRAKQAYSEKTVHNRSTQ